MPGDVLVTTHQRLTGFGSEVVLSRRPSTTAKKPDPIFVLSNWVGNADSIKQGLLACKQVGLAWTILDLQKPSHITDTQVCDVLDDMMQVGAHQGEHVSDGFVARGSKVEILQVLKDAGYANQITSDKWMLTEGR